MENMQLMHTLIERSYPDVPFSFAWGGVPSKEGGYDPYLCVTKEGALSFRLSVLADSTWADVQRVINCKLERNHTVPNACSICGHDSVATLINCNMCSNEICGECYIQLFAAGSGIIVCPYCRHETGRR